MLKKIALSLLTCVALCAISIVGVITVKGKPSEPGKPPEPNMSTFTTRPSSAGDATNLTPSAGANWENVDEVGADDGTTYNSGDDYDLYNLTNHGAEEGDITQVRVHFRYQSSTGASATGKARIKIGGTEYDGGDESTINWASYYHDWATNPQSTSAWTWTDIDNLQAGAHVSAGGAPKGELTQVYVEVTYTVPQDPPTVVLNTADETAFGADTTPTLEFTGTDPEDEDVRYNIQIDIVNTFDSLVDSYSEANGGLEMPLYGASITKNGQSFTGNGGTLASCKFHLRKNALPTGNAVATLYAHAGTFGSTGTPTGAVLATSDNFDVSTLTTDFQLISFTFTGENQVVLANGTKYFIVIEYSGGDVGNYVLVEGDSTSPTHNGNLAYYLGSWSAEATNDFIFYVYITSDLLDKVSGTDDLFTNTTDGGDTDPFDSGDLADFTVQVGDALVTDTYYWRVRGIDPTGSNTYGDWSATRSFTVGTAVAIASRRLLVGVGR